MSFFAVPLSGLTASQAQLQSISNNLANVDTDGYKDQSVLFSDLFAQASSVNGANDPLQNGQGVKVSATESNFTNGDPSPTGIPSNMALSGDGFFIVQQSSGQVAYSRDGDFTTNASGQLIAPSGALLLGYPATNGVVSTSSPLQPLNVGTGTTRPGTATMDFTVPTNLDSSTAIGGTYTGTIGVYDSLGTEHTLSINYTKTATNAATSTWSYTITAPTADTGATSATIATGNLTFDSSGNLTSPTGSVTGITIPSFTDGAAPMNLTWNLTDSTGSSLLTQTSIASGPTTTSTQNGTESASLTGYNILSDGTIEGTYSSGPPQALGQVAVATVENDQGLSQLGGNLFQVTGGSGAASIGVAGTNGRATITGGSVESSNVDEAAEFSNLIVAQQAYEANAKSVTTFDQVEQATLQMLSS